MYIFDTDFISALMRGAVPHATIRRLAQLPPEAQCTTAITAGELYYGAFKSRQRDQILPKVEQALKQLRVLSFNSAAARKYGELRSEFERAGTPLSTADLQIASIALARNMTLVTGNTRHLDRVPGLKIEDWLHA
jgi:tRNA(fMet)-specific endonuclease VapC